MKDPFNAPSEGVYPPITNEVVPCPSTKVRNFGTQTYEVAAGETQAVFWCYPSGTLTEFGLEGGGIQIAQAVNTDSVQFGPVLTPDGTGSVLSQRGVFSFFAAGPSTWVPTTAPLGGTGVGAPSQVRSAVWDQLINPFAIPGSTSDVKFRCTAFAIRISYTGKLTDTEGFVDFYNPYAWTGTAQTQRDLSSLRRDPSHRRYYFGNQRTHEYVWHPNCESCSPVSINASNPFDCRQLISRFMFSIGGIAAGDIFEIEAIGFQEYTGHPAVPTNTPSPVATDVVHVANAIPQLQGTMNKGATGGKTHTLEQHVAAQKVITADPKVTPHSGEDHESTVSKISKGVSTAASFASDVLPLLSMLML
jgi:hypothetical protein